MRGSAGGIGKGLSALECLLSGLAIPDSDLLCGFLAVEVEFSEGSGVVVAGRSCSRDCGLACRLLKPPTNAPKLEFRAWPRPSVLSSRDGGRNEDVLSGSDISWT